jgi:hypothetical protein
MKKDNNNSGNNTSDEFEPSITDDKEAYLVGEHKKLDNSDYLSQKESRQQSVEHTPIRGRTPMDALTRQTEIEKKIEENLRKAQSKLYQDMSERKLLLEKELVLHFHELCREIQKAPEFADKAHLLKGI